MTQATATYNWFNRTIKSALASAIGLGIVTAAPSWAEGDIQSIASIRTAAESFVASQPAVSRLDSAEVTAGRLDSRLRLPMCDQPLETFLPPGGRLIGKSNVGVRCTGSSPWTLYVPVTVTAYLEVPTAARSMQRGTILSAHDITLVQHPLHQLPAGHLSSLEDVEGMELKRTVQAGRTLTSSMITPPKLVKRGQQVTLIARNSSFEVRMNGTAMADGAAGERVRVKNLSSKKIVEGTVDANGAVMVDH